MANTMSPGSYTFSNNNTIVYQLTMDSNCRSYALEFDANGGTGTMEDQDIPVGTATRIDWNTLVSPTMGESYEDSDGNTIPAVAGKMWAFWGWNTKADGTGDWYKNGEEITDIANDGETLTLYAQWKQANLEDMAVTTSGTKTITNNTMQDMSAQICYNSDITTKAYLEANNKTGAVTLTDDRDGTSRSYDVSKLADGNCWMTTNLALGTTSEITLTSDDTDLEEGTTFTLPAGDTTSYTTNTYQARIRLTNGSNATTNGVYYTWSAAVTSATSLNFITVTTSVCPRNWDLPTDNQYGALSTASSYSSSNPTTALPSQFKVDGGFTNGSDFYQTTDGFYWTATSSGTSQAYGRMINTTTLYSSANTGTTYGGNKYYRKNIRCVASQGKVNISYHANNGSSDISNQTVEIAAGKLAASNLFTAATNRRFREWNTKADGTGTSYSAGASVSSTGLQPNQSLELYAIWDEVYYISFNANESSVGGTPGSATGTMTNQTVSRDTATAIKTSTFALSGYLFYGWNTSANGTGTFYSDGQKVTNLTSTGNTITLYAVWTNGAYLDTGQNVNQKLKRLAGNSSATYSTQDNTITAIVRSNTLPDDFIPATGNTISHSTSPTPIYAWYDSASTTIYYYSEATTILMNKNSNHFFGQMRALSNLSTISTWDTAKVTEMSSMFYYAGYSASSFTLDLSSWNTSSVRSMHQMFNYAGRSATTFNISYISNWDTSSVTNMNSMFSSAGSSATSWSIGNLSNWDTSSVTNMNSMFSSAGSSATSWSIGNLSNWDTSSVTNMSHMFNSAGRSATTFNISYISDWDTSKVTIMDGIFSYAGYSATTWSIGDLSDWDTSKVTTMQYMFSSAGYSATSWSIGDLSSWDTSSVTNMSYMFNSAGYSATTWSIGDLSDWDTSKVTTMQYMFSSAGYSANTWSIGDLSDWDTSNVTTLREMFGNAGRNATTWSIGDLSSWNTSSVTNMSSMFSSAGYSANAWSIGDLSDWNTSSVTDMSSMFSSAGYSATSWSIGDLSNWNTSGVTTMQFMFSYAGYSATTWSIGSDLSDWDTSKVTIMDGMFQAAGHSATIFTLDLSDWDTSNVTNMTYMFNYAGCNSSTFILNLSSWDTSNVTSMYGMFNTAGYNATTWSVTIPKTNDGTATGPIANTTSNLYGNTTSVTATPPLVRSFTLAD